MTSRETPIESDIHLEAWRLLAEIERIGVAARLLGGMAIRILAGDRMHPSLERPIQDLDFIVTKRDKGRLDTLLIEAGYLADTSFNALNGARRLLYCDTSHDRQIDVFVESFSMCHELPLAERIAVLQHTLPAAELLMTKLQIVHLNPKDRGDLYALLHSHTVGEGAGVDLSQVPIIEVDRIVSLTSSDWGLQRTFELNFERLTEGLSEQTFTVQEADQVAERIRVLAQAMDAAPKSRKWKLRDKVGERKRWYEEPEEVDR